MTGGGKGGDVIAVVIGMLLCSCGNGSGRVMARGARHESSGHAVSTTFLEGSIGKSDADVPSRLSAPDHRAEWLRDGTTWGSAGAPICTGVKAKPVTMRPRSSSHTCPR